MTALAEALAADQKDQADIADKIATLSAELIGLGLKQEAIEKLIELMVNIIEFRTIGRSIEEFKRRFPQP